mgnify:CR=1 FL=1
MGENAMKITDHALNPKQEYHFESSVEFCSPEIIKRVEKKVKESKSLSDDDSEQLKAIVKLELMRFEFANGSEELSTHSSKVQRVREELIKKTKREPFDNGEVDKAFYELLNIEYGYV